MFESIEFTQLIAGASSHGDELNLAQTLRTEFIESDPDDAATTAGKQGDRDRDYQ